MRANSPSKTPPFPSVAVTIIVSVGLGVIFSFLSIIVGTMASGIQ